MCCGLFIQKFFRPDSARICHVYALEASGRMVVLADGRGFLDKTGNTVPDFDRQWCRLASVCRDGQLDEAGPCIEGAVLVEDEVADAVIDRFAPVGLDRLKRVAVVSYDGICLCASSRCRGTARRWCSHPQCSRTRMKQCRSALRSRVTRITRLSALSWLTEGFCGR